MRITNNILINNLKSNIRTNIRNLDKYQMQLATGQRINRPSDDPVGLIDVMRLSSRLRDNEQYKANVKDALSWLTATESSLSVLADNMNRVHELTVYGATGTLTSADREAISTEIQRIREQVKDLINTTHSDRYVFGGTNTTRSPYDGSNWYDNTNRIYYEIGTGIKMPVNLTAQQVFKSTATVKAGAASISGATVTGQAGTAVIDGAVINITTADNPGVPGETIVTFDDGVVSEDVIVPDDATSVAGAGPFSGLTFAVGDVTTASGTISIDGSDVLSGLENIILHLETDPALLNGDIANIDKILSRVLTSMAEVGARTNHLDLTIERLLEQELNFKTLLSETGDVDQAEVILELTNQENVYKSALAVGARIIMPTLMDFLR